MREKKQLYENVMLIIYLKFRKIGLINDFGENKCCFYIKIFKIMFFNLQNRVTNSKNPLIQTVANHVLLYPTPVNFSYAYSFGSLVGIFFAVQILTGIFLAMHYTAHTSYAFASVVHIMADVKNGYLLRYMHANGASMVFILIYIHIGRGLYYRSYIYNRRYL